MKPKGRRQPLLIERRYMGNTEAVTEGLAVLLKRAGRPERRPHRSGEDHPAPPEVPTTRVEGL